MTLTGMFIFAVVGWIAAFVTAITAWNIVSNNNYYKRRICASRDDAQTRSEKSGQLNIELTNTLRALYKELHPDTVTQLTNTQICDFAHFSFSALVRATSVTAAMTASFPPEYDRPDEKDAS